MEIPRDQLIPILTLKVKVIFKLFSGRHELCNLRNLTVGRKSYAVAEILSTNKIMMDDLSEEDVKMGGFPTKDAFKVYWHMMGYREYNPIYVIRFNIVRLTSLGKWHLKRNGEHIPIIRENMGDTSIKPLGKWKRNAKQMSSDKEGDYIE